jgi:hypothetical protein
LNAPHPAEPGFGRVRGYERGVARLCFPSAFMVALLQNLSTATRRFVLGFIKSLAGFGCDYGCATMTRQTNIMPRAASLESTLYHIASADQLSSLITAYRELEQNSILRQICSISVYFLPKFIWMEFSSGLLRIRHLLKLWRLLQFTSGGYGTNG